MSPAMSRRRLAKHHGAALQNALRNAAVARADVAAPRRSAGARQHRLLAVVAFASVMAFSGIAPAQEDLRELSLDPAQWVMPAKNYASTRYSELDQIDSGTRAIFSSNGVSRLASTGARKRHPSS